MQPFASYHLTDCPHDVVVRLQQALGCSETLAWVLARRGVHDPQEAHALLHPVDPTSPEGAALFGDPMQLGDMAAAVERIRYAIDRGEQIVVHGDYDADGVCSTTLLVEALEALGADVLAFLPSRFSNGYGLHIDTVDRLAEQGMRLLITVDCGITAVEPIAQANDRGVDVIVCDHHEPGPELPSAIICSTRPSSYPFPHLCATAVAGKLAQALGAPYGDAQHELEAIATVADCVPLVAENRHIVRRGLAALRRTTRPGLRALMGACGVQVPQADEQDIAFRLAPRINAVGRIDDADHAYELLRATDNDVARNRAALLHDMNARRKEIESEVYEQAVQQVEQLDDEAREARAYVVSGEGWHEGVVGIVAARLAERYYRPVIAIGWAGALGRGSGRSIPGFDLHGALAACDDLLVRWGGHAAAAGLTVDPARIDELRVRLADHARIAMGDRCLRPVERVDAVLAGDELGMHLVEELNRLAPFGEGNPRPHLLAASTMVSNMQQVGADRTHLRCTLTTGGVSTQAIGFGQAQACSWLNDGDRVDACVRASINSFRGAQSLQLEITRLIPLPDSAPHVAGMCFTTCGLECTDRIAVGEVIAQAAAPSPLARVDAASPPAIEPLLARPDTIDVRHRDRALAHVTRLATGGASLLVVCSDVSRRRDVLAGPLHPHRLGVQAAVLASSRCARLGATARLRSLGRADGPVLALTDYALLGDALAAGVSFDALVVLDPPVTDQQRDLLAGAPIPLHLTWGAAEVRFAFEVAARVGDVRQTLGEAWRRMRHAGALASTELDVALFSAGNHLHTPEAVSHGLHELFGRGIMRLAEGGAISLAEPATGPTPAPVAGS